VQYESLVDVLLPDILAKVGTFNEAEEEFVYDLQMWPSEFQYGFILFRIKRIARWVDLRRYRAEKIGCKL
jgi:hypothetical protein